MTTCSVEGCGGVARSRGWCGKHYQRWQRYGDPLIVLKAMAEKGAPQEFIEMALRHEEDDKACLFWPHARNIKGYAIHGRDSVSVCRYICERVYGPPPSPTHQAAHICGKGDQGCVNPHHLEWKTPIDNNKDKEIHGTTNRGEQSGMAKLTWEKAREIKAMKGKLSGPKVAAIYGVSHAIIYQIWSDKMWRG